MWPVCNKGLTLFLLPPTHESYHLASGVVCSGFVRGRGIDQSERHCPLLNARGLLVVHFHRLYAKGSEYDTYIM